MKHKFLRATTFFLTTLSFIWQSTPVVEGKGSSGGGRGSGGSVGGGRYTSSSSSKSFGGKAVSFGAGAYVGSKIAKKVTYGAS